MAGHTRPSGNKRLREAGKKEKQVAKAERRAQRAEEKKTRGPLPGSDDPDIAGIVPGSSLPAYDTSKAALGGLCRHVAHEGARRGIRANVVAPGLMDTPIGRAASAGRPSRNRTPVPLQRQGTAWEIAYATVFLLSNEASYITGQTLVVDGGLTALL